MSPHRSTTCVHLQDALLALYEDVTKDPSLAQLKAIVAGDLQKAFNNATLGEVEVTR